MPTLSRYFIRSSFIYLGIGFTVGGLILTAKAGYIDARLWAWLPVHIALLMDGWLIQLTLGVAYWILPRIELHDRGRPTWAWAGFVAMQLGLALALVCLLILWLPDLGVLYPVAVGLQAAGVLLFAVHAWPRIRPAMIRTAPAAPNKMVN